MGGSLPDAVSYDWMFAAGRTGFCTGWVYGLAMSAPRNKKGLASHLSQS